MLGPAIATSTAMILRLISISKILKPFCFAATFVSVLLFCFFLYFLLSINKYICKASRVGRSVDIDFTDCFTSRFAAVYLFALSLHRSMSNISGYALRWDFTIMAETMVMTGSMMDWQSLAADPPPHC